jgi:hypothetical protein
LTATKGKVLDYTVDPAGKVKLDDKGKPVMTTEGK